MSFAFHPIVTALVALGPAALAYWRGRALLAHLDDPALPERLLALQSRNASVFGVAIGVLIATASHHVVWALPLLVLARMLVAYPFRKALHNETWSLWAYLSFYCRLWLAATGFWLLVAVAPAIASTAGGRDWIVASVLGLVATAWHARFVSAFKALVGARPVDAPLIRARFDRLLNDAGLPGIALDQVNMRGGSFTNAVALASTRNPAVVVTDTLLERLDEDEVTAILAHELAHHEHFTPARLNHASLVTWALIGAAVVLPSIVRLAHLPGIVFVIWAVTIFVGLILNLQRRQKHETESDLRAVALTRDPEALVRALTKLHAAARIPRRWEADFERRATHPSLARRIQAIRRASGGTQRTLPGPSTFAAPGSTASVTFQADRLEWHEGSSMTHAIGYQSLREVRVNARSPAAPQLIAVDSSGRRWSLPLHTEDVGRVQSVLDVIDVHLAKPDGAAAAIAAPRMLALTMAVIALAAGQFAVLFSGVLAAIQPAAQITAAAGVAALAAAGLAWRDGVLWNLTDFNSWLPLTLGLGGTALVAIALSSRSDSAGGSAPGRLVAALAAAAVSSWLLIVYWGLSPLHLHRNLHESAAVVVLTCAAAAALALDRSKTYRRAAVAVALAGIAAGYAGSTDFVDRFVADPFVAPASAVDSNPQAPSASVKEFSIDFYPSSMWISGAGGYVAVATEDAHEQSTIHAGDAGGVLTSFNADRAAFLGEREVLLVEGQGRESVLRLIDLGTAAREVWTLTVPVRRPNLSVDRSSRRWRLLGQNGDGDIISAEGVIGAPEMLQSQWAIPDRTDYLAPLAVSSGTVIAMETSYDDSRQFLQTFLWAGLWSLGRAESSLWSLSDRDDAVLAVSSAELTCHASVSFDEPAACVAFDGTRTRVFTIDAKTRGLSPRMSVRGQLHAFGVDDRGWLKGWWDRSAVAVNPATRELVRLHAARGEQPFHLAVSDSVVAGIFSEGGDYRVRVFQRQRRISD